MDGEKQKIWFAARMVLVLAVCAIAAYLIANRAYRLQIVDGAKHRLMAEEQYLRELEIPSRRGTIADRNGVELAISAEVDSVFIQPGAFKKDGRTGEMKSKARLADDVVALGRVLDINPKGILAKTDTKSHFQWLKRRVSRKEAAEVAKLQFAGVSLVKEYQRRYPLKALASQVVGFTDIDGEGQGGVEKTFNQSLRGEVHFASGFRDALGRELIDEGSVSEAETEGHRIELTIDAAVQNMAEAELRKAVKEHGAAGGFALVMDPHTGEIHALANYPTFDPNEPGDYDPAARNNQILTNPFEPGSTMKSFVLLSALQEGIVKPGDTFDCENGRWPIGSRVIHDDHPKGILNLVEVIKYSSNICTAKIGLRLGREKLYSYLRSFGFGETTGILLPAETRGLLWPGSRWADINTATISFGQGVSVSALQLATAYSMIANGGKLVRPLIVRRIVNQKGEVVKEFKTEVVRQSVSPEVARLATEILSTVTQNSGTGSRAALDGFPVAGKTGTAQKVDRVTKGYSADKRMGLFAGFVPADRPRFTVLVVIDEPKGIAYGGVVAAPAFKAIATTALRNAGVFPQAAATAADQDQEGAPEEGEPAGEAITEGAVKVAAGPDRVPNFIGMPMRSVIETGVSAGIELEIEGTGRAVKQNPPAGAKYGQGGRKCKIYFSKG